MRTEEEARKCWCPMARIPWFDGPQAPNPKFVVMGSVNRTPVGFGGEQPPVIARCIASECQMWEFLDGAKGDCMLKQRRWSGAL